MEKTNMTLNDVLLQYKEKQQKEIEALKKLKEKLDENKKSD